MTDDTREPVALATLSVYGFLGGNMRSPGYDPIGEATDKPDEYADRVLAEVAPEPVLAWRQTGGDNHGDGLTSWDYVAELPDVDAVRAFMRWLGAEPGDGTPNLGIITGPEEYGLIPGGMTWDMDGMQWNISGVSRIAACDGSVFPITIEAARAVFGAEAIATP